MPEPTEIRTHRITLAVTAEEKSSVAFVCKVLQTDASNLLREHPLDWVLFEAKRIRQVAK